MDQSVYIVKWGNGKYETKPHEDKQPDWVTCMARKFHRQNRAAIAWLRAKRGLDCKEGE